MGTIRIGADTRSLEDADASWIANEIGGRRNEAVAVCVEVKIHENGANLRLATPACPGGGRSRRLSPLESEIADLWRKHRLDTDDFSVGNLISFVKRLLRLLGREAA